MAKLVVRLTRNVEVVGRCFLEQETLLYGLVLVGSKNGF